MGKAFMTIAAGLGAIAIIFLAADLHAAARAVIVMGLTAFGVGFGWSLFDRDDSDERKTVA